MRSRKLPISQIASHCIARRGAKQQRDSLGLQPRWKSADSAFPVDAGHHGCAFGEQFLAPKNFVALLDASATSSNGARAEGDSVVEKCGCEVSHRRFRHDEIDAFFFQ